MTTKDQMQQVLTALRESRRTTANIDTLNDVEQAIAVMQQAVDAPEVEPFAYCYVQSKSSADILTFDDAPKDLVEGTLIPLYATQPLAPDCRTCVNRFDLYYSSECGYSLSCTNGDKYQPAPAVVLWRTV